MIFIVGSVGVYLESCGRGFGLLFIGFEVDS